MAEEILVFCTVPDADCARKISQKLVEDRLAACVTSSDNISSVYRWEGQVENSIEVLLTIKTLMSRYTEVEKAILALHPYEVPEILAVPVLTGFSPYLKWMAESSCA